LDGFDINLSKTGAFGTGINLTTDIINLRPYYCIICKIIRNYIVICKVKYNKRKFNTSGPEMIDKYTSKPKYDFSTINNNRKIYDALYVKRHDIYVIPNVNQIYPLAIGKIKFTKDETYKEYAN